MKLKEIINESMALKFDSLEKKIRSSSMTVSQFKKLLYHEYDVYAILELNNNYEPFTANGASISTRRHDTTTDDEVLPPEAHGKYIMHIGVGPGSTRGTLPVKEIVNFMRIVRHELSHINQSEDNFGIDDEYHDAVGAGSYGKNLEKAKYFLQNSERSQHIVDLASFLSNLGGTPEIFFEIMNEVKQFAIADFRKSNKFNFGKIRQHAKIVTNNKLGKSSGRKSEDMKSGFRSSYIFIIDYAETFAISSLSKNKEFKAKINSFKRGLEKKFKQIDAIERSNREDVIKSNKSKNTMRLRQKRNQ